jgi:hypothetical protein
MIVASRSWEPFTAFMTASMIAGLVLLVYLALVFDASELRANRRFLGSTLVVGSAVSWLLSLRRAT